MYVSGAHNSAVTCVEWCPDGELLYSGDIHGKVYVTVVKFQEVRCTVDCILLTEFVVFIYYYYYYF